MTDKIIEQLAVDFFHLVPLMRKNIMKPFDQMSKTLSHMQIHILLKLKDQEPISMSELAAKMDILKQQLTFLTNKLEDLGYIERIHDKKDRRSVKVSITPVGIEALEEYRKQALALIINKFEQLPPEQIVELHTAIQTIYKIISVL